jgi:oligoendopeptidase F
VQQATNLPKKSERNFVPNDLDTNSWAALEPFFIQLENKSIQTLPELQQWLKDWSELETVVSENARWLYVHTTLDTANVDARNALINMYQHIQPQLSTWDNKLAKKFVASPAIDELDKNLFHTTIRKIKKGLELFREENVALNSQQVMLQSKFGEITGAQSIQYNGQEITLQQAGVYQRSSNRAQREEVFKLVNNRLQQDSESLDTLLTELIALRHKIATNAGYQNFIEYRFDELGRFDYTPEDCLRFHEAAKDVIVPLMAAMNEEKRQKLGLDVMRPWDMNAEPGGEAPLSPSTSGEDLLEKTIACFRELDPYFAERIEIMREMKYLDLESRLNKSPGGYNMTMPEIGVPFIFMNSANSEHDLITMVHEGGHAIHTFLSHPLELYAFKEITSEIAEVASMSMELMTMDYWHIFYNKPEELKRAKKNHLQYILGILSRTCMGDSFQFWLYSNPNHTVEQRRQKWAELNKQFTGSNADWSGYENVLATGYQRILHFYEVPFYYIEYAFAELGAIAVWKNFKNNPKQAVEDYKKALSLGFTAPIPVFYETAGAKFDFSKEYVAELAQFVQEELKKLN